MAPRRSGACAASGADASRLTRTVTVTIPCLTGSPPVAARFDASVRRSRGQEWSLLLVHRERPVHVARAVHHAGDAPARRVHRAGEREIGERGLLVAKLDVAVAVNGIRDRRVQPPGPELIGIIADD